MQLCASPLPAGSESLTFSVWLNERAVIRKGKVSYMHTAADPTWEGSTSGSAPTAARTAAGTQLSTGSHKVAQLLCGNRFQKKTAPRAANAQLCVGSFLAAPLPREVCKSELWAQPQLLVCSAQQPLERTIPVPKSISTSAPG